LLYCPLVPHSNNTDSSVSAAQSASFFYITHLQFRRTTTHIDPTAAISNTGS
jgi:hypothetical protein